MNSPLPLPRSLFGGRSGGTAFHTGWDALTAFSGETPLSGSVLLRLSKYALFSSMLSSIPVLPVFPYKTALLA